MGSLSWQRILPFSTTKKWDLRREVHTRLDKVKSRTGSAFLSTHCGNRICRRRLPAPSRQRQEAARLCGRFRCGVPSRQPPKSSFAAASQARLRSSAEGGLRCATLRPTACVENAVAPLVVGFASVLGRVGHPRWHFPLADVWVVTGMGGQVDRQLPSLAPT